MCYHSQRHQMLDPELEASIRNRIGQADASIDDMHKWIVKAGEQGAELILFPELNVGGHALGEITAQIAEPVPGPSTEKIINLAGKEDMIICFGIIEREGEGVFCSHVLVDGGGIIGKQRKIHVPAQEQPYWQAGDAIHVFDLGKAKVGITICRDSFFGEMTRTLYFKGAEIVLIPFGYYNVPRSQYLKETIHGMSIIQSAWTNGFYAIVCNSAEGREPSQGEPHGRKFPGWAGVISPWGRVISFVDSKGNSEAMIVEQLDPAELEDRRNHPNFLAKELRPDLYQFVNTDRA
jgi:N-carbamoylputrescine amidase